MGGEIFLLGEILKGFDAGFFYLDPCNLHPGEAAIVASRLIEELQKARSRDRAEISSAATRKARRLERLLRWPD